MGFEEQGATPSRAKHHRGFNHRVILGTKQLSRGKNTSPLGALKHRAITKQKKYKGGKTTRPRAPKWGCCCPHPSPSVSPREKSRPGGAPLIGVPFLPRPANHLNPILIINSLLSTLGWVVVWGRGEEGYSGEG
jgi:hypothetical protein